MTSSSNRPAFYLIPGLGADERVFQFLQLNAEMHVVRWLPLQSATEALPEYAGRLAAAVPMQEHCWLVGVSFGGILALEIARLRPLAQVVLISSLANQQQLPTLLRLARVLGLYRLLPPELLHRLPRVAQWFFGARNGAEYRLLHQIIRDTAPAFAHWAIARLLQWNSGGVGPAIRLHGTHDRLLPANPAQVDYSIAGGGHFMIVSHAAQISRVLNELVTASKYDL